MTTTPEEPERIRGTPIAWTIAAAIAAVAVSTIVVAALVGFELDGGGRGDDREVRSRPPAAPFDQPTVLELQRSASVLELDGWHWADAAHTRVRLPVAIAIDRYVGAGR